MDSETFRAIIGLSVYLIIFAIVGCLLSPIIFDLKGREDNNIDGKPDNR